MAYSAGEMTGASVLAAWHYHHGTSENDTLRYLWLKYPHFTTSEIARANELGKQIVRAGLDFLAASDQPASDPADWNQSPENDSSIQSLDRPRPE